MWEKEPCTVVLHGEYERILDLCVDVPLVAPHHAHNGEDEQDEGEDKVGAQHGPMLLKQGGIDASKN